MQYRDLPLVTLATRKPGSFQLITIYFKWNTELIRLARELGARFNSEFRWWELPYSLENSAYVQQVLSGHANLDNRGLLKADAEFLEHYNDVKLNGFYTGEVDKYV